MNRGKNEDTKEKKAEMPSLLCTEILMHMLITTHQEEDGPDHPESIAAQNDQKADSPAKIAARDHPEHHILIRINILRL